MIKSELNGLFERQRGSRTTQDLGLCFIDEDVKIRAKLPTWMTSTLKADHGPMCLGMPFPHDFFDQFGNLLTRLVECPTPRRRDRVELTPSAGTQLCMASQIPGSLQ